MNKYMLIPFVATFFSTISQIMLKKSANLQHKSWIYEYLNWRVILAYFIFFAVLLVNTFAYTHMDMKYGAVIDGLTYTFVMVMSFLLLKEQFTKAKLLGNLLIVVGVIVYML